MKHRAAGFLLVMLAAVPAGAEAPEPTGPRWDFVVTIADLNRGMADIDWTLNGLEGDVRVCPDMQGAERGVTQAPRQVEPAGERALNPDGKCWVAAGVAAGAPLHLRYRYDLARMAGGRGDPDYVARSEDDYIFQDETVMLRPDPLPRNAPITVEFRLPAGASVATPWARVEGPGWHFRYDSEHYDGGSYIAVGKLRPLGELKVRNGIVAMTALVRPTKVSDDVLRRWVTRAVGSVADFYGEVPGGRVHMVLVPVGSDRGAVFGTVLRRGPPSVVLFFGAEAREEAFNDDWVAPHELFHMGNPAVEGKIPWFIEGFTTYYQDIIRARAGLRPVPEMWGDLHDGFRHCDPDDGVSLGDESRKLRSTYHYTRVYWGGACLAFRLDVAIRQHTQGKASLDTVMLDLRQRGREGALSESDVIDALDRAAGSPVARDHLRARRPISLAPLYSQLGIEPTGTDTVRLHEDAPLAPLRRAIMGSP